MSENSTFPKMLSQDDVAVLLRRSVHHVQQLRLKRKLTYISGRPVRIAEDDVAEYVARIKVRRVKSSTKPCSPQYISAGGPPKAFKLLTAVEAAERFSIPVKKIRYLCLMGHVPYIRGRPRIFDEYDLTDYFDEKRRAKLAKTPGSPEHAKAQSEKVGQRIRHRLRVKALRRKFTKMFPG